MPAQKEVLNFVQAIKVLGKEPTCPYCVYSADSDILHDPEIICNRHAPRSATDKQPKKRRDAWCGEGKWDRSLLLDVRMDPD